MKPTIKDIAKEAQVSITTVSFVLNGKCDSISEDTIKKVKEIAQKYNYKPNSLAVSLVTKKTKTVGLIIPDIQNIFFSSFAKALEGELSKSGYSLILCNTDNLFEREKTSIELLLNRNVDAIILSPAVESLLDNNKEQLFQLLESTKVPFIIVDRELGTKHYSKVLSDNRYGGYIATKHLIGNNHEKIGCFTGPLRDISVAQQRLFGYQDALKEANIPLHDEYVYECNFDYESGYRLAKRVLPHLDITGLFVCNDFMAYGIYQACQELGIKIPEDLSIVGFDDMYFSRILTVPLTSVKQDIAELSEITSRLILEKMNSKELITKTITIKPSLTIRKSVKKMKEAA